MRVLNDDPLTGALARTLAPIRDLGGLTRRLAQSGEEAGYRFERMIAEIASALARYMWAARAVRASGWPDANFLLAKLRDDPYTDDNGFYLVREAAGFAE